MESIYKQLQRAQFCLHFAVTLIYLNFWTTRRCRVMAGRQLMHDPEYLCMIQSQDAADLWPVYSVYIYFSSISAWSSLYCSNALFFLREKDAPYIKRKKPAQYIQILQQGPRRLKKLQPSPNWNYWPSSSSSQNAGASPLAGRNETATIHQQIPKSKTRHQS